MNVKTWYGVPEKKGMFGVEIEVEGSNIPIEDTHFWHVTHDNSLRGESCEYVLKKPLSILGVKKALNELNDKLADSQLNFSYRTSVHVHVNVQNFNKNQLGNLVYLAFLFEEPMIRMCGESRIGNRFCLRNKDAAGSLDYITEAFSRKGRMPDVDENELRYMAVNLGAIAKFGSVEFRAMRGTTDSNLLMLWVGILKKLRDAAEAAESPLELAKENVVDLFYRVFNEHADVLRFPGIENELRRSYSQCIDFPHMGNWDKPAVELEKAAPLKKVRGARMDGFLEMLQPINPVRGLNRDDQP